VPSHPADATVPLDGPNSHVVHEAGVPAKHALVVHPFDVPEVDRGVLAHTRQHRSIRPGYREVAHALLATKHADQLSILCVPEPVRPVQGSRNEATTVRVKARLGDPVRVPKLERPGLPNGSPASSRLC
jgi:hypothetical protein